MTLPRFFVTIISFCGENFRHVFSSARVTFVADDILENEKMHECEMAKEEKEKSGKQFQKYKDENQLEIYKKKDRVKNIVLQTNWQ